MQLSQRLIAIRPLAHAGRVKQPFVEFGEWLPDQADLDSPGVTDALNVIPAVRGYRPFPGLEVISDALAARCQGAAAASDAQGSVTLVAGDAAALYRLVDQTWNDASIAGGYSTAADGSWEFALHGLELVATNYDDEVQSMTLGTDTLFSNLITSANTPRARHVDVIGRFLVLGNTSDETDGVVPNRVWWSGINDPLDFTPAASTQSDFQNIPEGGWVQRIVGGPEWGLVFLERKILRMFYTGAAPIFDLDNEVDRRRGTPIPNSVINFGRMVFFISEEGFFVNDGAQSTPIGDQKVDREFWDQFDPVYISRVSAAVDPVNKLVLWTFPGTGATGGNPNQIYIYHWPTGKWARADQAVQILARVLSQGYTLDTIPASFGNLDALPFSLDSRAWTGGHIRLGAFDASNQLNSFTGANLQATLDTREFQPFQGRRSFLSEIWPIIDGGTITAQVGTREREIDAVSFSAAASQNAAGFCPVLDSGRYHRVRAIVAAGGSWTHALGVEVKAADQGVY